MRRMGAGELDHLARRHSEVRGEGGTGMGPRGKMY